MTSNHIQLHYLPDRNVRKLSRAKRFESSGLVVWLNMVKNSRRDRFTGEDSIGLDGSIDESVPGSTPGSANGLRASTRWEHPTVPKDYHRSRVPYSSTLLFLMDEL